MMHGQKTSNSATCFGSYVAEICKFKNLIKVVLVYILLPYLINFVTFSHFVLQCSSFVSKHTVYIRV